MRWLAIIVLTACHVTPSPMAPERITATTPITVAGVEAAGARAAIDEVNRAAGCTVALWAPLEPYPDVTIVDGAFDPAIHRYETGEDAYLSADRSHGVVVLRGIYGPHVAYAAIAHGLGHLLGLRHGRGLMRADVLRGIAEFPLPWFSEADAAALEAYCQ